MKVTIDRAKWNTGTRLGAPALWTRIGATEHLCCLGFLGRACGVDEALLRKHREAGEAIDQFDGDGDRAYPAEWPAALFETVPGTRERWEYPFMGLNDAKGIDHATRESWIAEGFRIVLGVEVEFVGEYTGEL